jgi:SAM-dependent methyltransferase
MASEAGGSAWVDRATLRAVQYRTDANLAARQALYAYQHPRLNIHAMIVDLAETTGADTVADVACGNGYYLAELARRGHRGHLLGWDLSRGMLEAARRRAPAARLLEADAGLIPLATGSSELTLAAHMLYHMPDPQATSRELRRVTRPGGRVLVGLNGADHLRELRAHIAGALDDAAPGGPAGGAGLAPHESIDLDKGQRLLAGVFTSVIRHDFVAELRLPGREPIEDYVRSMIVTQRLPGPEPLVRAVTSRLRPGTDGLVRVRTHSGCLVCS